ncbi:hypothetical protein KOR42_39920 [Thalassoglobus neptunius]|uniref:ArnR1-like winged helix-turn-helix domain-containing protein n=1 Tax=Thalassoglobus neptunius TaxID=1938619 RepID=A0A5C5WEN1_9PLAN|nr:hypothetical protein [Thalassoglobus neptunius]TWT48202.1 hypothetical protein KOR42_39920 [Thalassoglobus neptunius]
MPKKHKTEHPPEYLTILRHMLGANSSRPGYRNHYCAEVNSASHSTLLDMAMIGLVKPGRIINQGADRYFHATPAGMAAVGVERILD